MKTEIERKFLVQVDKLPADLGAMPHHYINQGYLSYSPVVRACLRLEVPSGRLCGFLTVKGPGMVSRSEFEYEIPRDDALNLLDLSDAKLRKVRYFVPFNGETWELDMFEGALAGLWLAELELPDADAVFRRPPWVGREVTQEPRYTNMALARAQVIPEDPTR